MASAKKGFAVFCKNQINIHYANLKVAIDENNAEKVELSYAKIEEAFKFLLKAKNMLSFELTDKADVAKIETEMNEFMLNVEKEYQEFLKVDGEIKKIK